MEQNMKISAVVYDIEIEKAICGRGEVKTQNIEYCQGWRDHAGMGISVIGAYDYWDDRWRVFSKDNMKDFFDLLRDREFLVGFNSIHFDNVVISATYQETSFPWHESNVIGNEPNKCYDILREIWRAEGLGPKFSPSTHGGYSLDACARKNLGVGKTGNGALAPVQWQQGKIASVIDYCLQDVALTKKIFDLILEGTRIISPKTDDLLKLREVRPSNEKPLGKLG